MQLDKIIKQVSEELDIPQEVCHRAYMSAWKFINEKAQEHKLTVDTPLDEFKKYRKFHLTESDFRRKNKKYLAIQKFKKEKYDKGDQDD